MAADVDGRRGCPCGDRCAAATRSRSPWPGWPRRSGSVWSGGRAAAGGAGAGRAAAGEPGDAAGGDPGAARGRVPGVAPGPQRRHVRASRAPRRRRRPAGSPPARGHGRGDPPWHRARRRGRAGPAMGDSLHDALDFRRVLEPGAAGAGRRPARLSGGATGSSWSPACRAPRTRDPATRRVADSRLHLAIAAASGSPSLAAAVADVQLTPRPAAGRDPGAAPQPRPLRRPARPHRRGDPGRRRGGRPRRDGGALRRAPRRCCAACWVVDD